MSTAEVFSRVPTHQSDLPFTEGAVHIEDVILIGEYLHDPGPSPLLLLKYSLLGTPKLMQRVLRIFEEA